jgi:hypothetical protein
MCAAAMLAGCGGVIAPVQQLKFLTSRGKQTDKQFLDDMSRRAFLYFWEQSDPRTGLVRDRMVRLRRPRTDMQRVSRRRDSD